MTTKDIRTSQAHVSCDVCGRTLLRGEYADTYLSGGHRREVCELCQPRARHEGWVRADAILEQGTGSSSAERRRSFISRLRRSRSDERPARPQRQPAEEARGAPALSSAAVQGDVAAPLRPQRQVRAVPTNVEQRIASAIDHYNGSEFPRTTAGVARSLGEPVVVVRAQEEPVNIVTVVISWELCWYRYEVDLDGGAVRIAGQGYELEELEPADRVDANARADEYGLLTPLSA